MSNSKESIFSTGTAPDKDWFLQFLVNLANKNQFELDITLTVGGLLVSGTLTGVRDYFDNMGTYFASPFDNKANSGEVSAAFKKIGDQCSCIAPSEQTDRPSYIHLKNVIFHDSQGQSTIARESTWWRGRLSEVQGFAAGRVDDNE